MRTKPSAASSAPNFKPRGGSYSQVPAGATPQNRSAIYVTMKSRQRYEGRAVVKPTSNPSVTRFDCPDRVLHVVTADGGKPNADLVCPIRKDSFDYVVYLDPYSTLSAHYKYTNRILISAVTGIRSGFHDADYIPKSTDCLLDSGGAQLRLGTFQYISPYMIIDWMNKMGGEGMALDVPPRLEDDTNEVVMKEAAEIQKLNNGVFQKHVDRDRVKLLNVSHGFSLKQIREWMKRVGDERFQGLAAGNDLADTMLQIMRNILVPAIESPYPEQRKRIHSFGISGGTAVPACTWLARNMPEGTDYTTDSSSWLVGCNFGAYYVFTDKSAIHQWLMWHKKRTTATAYIDGMTCPCSCEVCSAVRWLDVFRHPGYCTGLLMSYHNLFVLKSYESLWRSHAKKSSNLGEYLEMVRNMDSRKAQHILGAIKYVDYAFKHGLDEADKRYTAALSTSAIGVEMEELFAEDADEQVPLDEGRLQSKTLNVTELKKLDSVAGILKHYRTAGIAEYLAGKAKRPEGHTVYTGFQMTSRLISQASNASRKNEKAAEAAELSAMDEAA